MDIRLGILCICCLLISFFSCETRFEDDTRILVKGKVEDAMGNPIRDAEIIVTTNSAISLFSEDEFILGQNLSESDGSFAVTSLFKQDDDFNIRIDAGEMFSKYVYITNTENYTPDNLVFNLQNTALYALGSVNYDISRTSSNENSLQYSFKYNGTICYETFEEGVLIESEDDCFDNRFENGILNDSNSLETGDFTVLLGTTVEFTYSINQQPEITETFIIDQENYEFTFTY